LGVLVCAIECAYNWLSQRPPEWPTAADLRTPHSTEAARSRFYSWYDTTHRTEGGQPHREISKRRPKPYENKERKVAHDWLEENGCPSEHGSKPCLKDIFATGTKRRGILGVSASALQMVDLFGDLDRVINLDAGGFLQLAACGSSMTLVRARKLHSSMLLSPGPCHKSIDYEFGDGISSRL
jgi:hypothetical protein